MIPQAGLNIYMQSNDRLLNWHEEQESAKNALRSYAFYVLLTFWILFRLCLQGTMIAKRKDLCKLQDTFSIFDTTMKYTKVTKKTRLLLLFCLIFFLNKIFSQLDDGLKMHEVISNESRPGFWLFFIAAKICQFFIHCFELQAMMLYLQLSCNLLKSVEKICLDSNPNMKVLENTVDLMKRLKIISKFLSWYIFYLTMLFIFKLIFHVYLLFELLATSSTTDWTDIIADICSIVAPALGLWIINVQSEEVQQSLQDLKENIQNSEVDKTNYVEINGKKHNEKYAREIVFKMLDEFDGFDAIGFFNLGKDLLLSIVIKIMEIVFVLVSLRFSFK